jgi:hypothetical protein
VVVLDTHDTMVFVLEMKDLLSWWWILTKLFFALVLTLLVFVLWWVVNRLLKPPQWRLARRFGQWEGRGGGSFSHTTWPQNPQVFLKVITPHTSQFCEPKGQSWTRAARLQATRPTHAIYQRDDQPDSSPARLSSSLS